MSKCDTSLEEGCRLSRAPVGPADKLRETSTPQIVVSALLEQRRLAVERRNVVQLKFTADSHTHTQKYMGTHNCLLL